MVIGLTTRWEVVLNSSPLNLGFSMDYPAKILLFGEYGIILDSMALSVPYERFSGQIRISNKLSSIEFESNYEIKKLLSYFKVDLSRFQFINIGLLEEEINQGLYFDSSIQYGSGLGSSGALTAAIYERYLFKTLQNDYQKMRMDLAVIESHFHGKSSGLDPLVSLLNKPLLIEAQSSVISVIDLSAFLNSYTIFLINTHSTGNTGALVNEFMERRQNKEFRNNIDNEYIPIINQTIGAVINSDFISFDHLISKYSLFQLSHFTAMIPKSMRSFFGYGIESGEYYLKLCGSGGGGYILGIARNRLKAEAYFNLNHLEYMVV
jgi:mevalonate kinase